MEKQLEDPIASIIIVSFNEANKTVKCFQSIRAYCPLPREIIWVDNGSTPSEFGLMRRAATRPRMRCKLIKHPNNVGFIKGVNSAIPEIDKRSKYVILLNNDTEVGPKTFTKMIRPFQQNNNAGLTSCITQSTISWQTAEHLNRRWPDLQIPKFGSYHGNVVKYTRALEKKFSGKGLDVTKMNIAFFAAAFRKETFVHELGGLDEAFGIGLGEDDFACHKLRSLGYHSYLALDAFVFHHHRTTFRALKLSTDSIRRANLRTLRRKVKEINKNGLKTTGV